MKGIRVKSSNKDMLGAKEVSKYGDLLPEEGELVSIVGKGLTAKAQKAYGGVISNFIEVMRRPGATRVSGELEKALGKNFAKQFALHQSAAKSLPRSKAHIKMERELFTKMLTKLASAIPENHVGKELGTKYRTEIKQTAKHIDAFVKQQDAGSYIRLYSKYRSSDPRMVGKPVIQFGIATGGGKAGVVADTRAPRDKEISDEMNKHFRGQGGLLGTGGGASGLARVHGYGFNTTIAPKHGSIKPAGVAGSGDKGEPIETSKKAAKGAVKNASGAAKKGAKKGKTPSKKAQNAQTTKNIQDIDRQISEIEKKSRKNPSRKGKPSVQAQANIDDIGDQIEKLVKPAKKNQPQKKTPPKKKKTPNNDTK